VIQPATGFAGWKHAVLIYQKFHMDATYKEIVDWAEEMDRIRLLLSLPRGEFPHYSTLCKAYKRTSMRVWRQLLQPLGGATASQRPRSD